MKNLFAALGKVLLGVLAGLALSASAWAQTVTIVNPINNGVYTTPYSFTVIARTTGTGIAKVDFYQGTTLIGSASTATYVISWNNVAPGSYTLTAQAKDSAGAVLATSSPVAVLVNAAPTINLTSPSNNQLFATGSNIVFNATASDSDGTVSKVDFYRAGSGTPVGTATSAPYTATWSNAPAGSHAFLAKATDNRGGTKTSYAVTIVVAAPPTISLDSPTANQFYPAPANVTLTASASPGSGGTLSKVEFYQGDTLIGTATAAPYSMTWSNVPAAAGSYLLTAKATDNRGLSTTSAIIPITVNAAPSIAITRPSNNQVMSAPANVTLTATAGDADGGIGKVDFYQGTTLIGTATAAPYSIVWSNVPAGTYTLTAQATDNRGIPTTSAPVSVVVNPAGEATGMYFIHPDHLGTPRAITDNTGQTVWRWDNDEPFGDNLANTDPQATGTTFQFNLRFPGQYFDQETGNHYNYFRDYDPGTGRYTTSDPIGLAGGQWSTYGYADNAPTMYSDPLGLATYMCTKPLHGLGPKWGPQLYPESKWNPLPTYHQFLCFNDGEHRPECGGMDRSGSALWSDGKPSEDSWPANSGEGQCEKVDDRKCVDHCVLRRIRDSKRPGYGIGPQRDPGDCQEWADDVIKQCQRECRGKK